MTYSRSFVHFQALMINIWCQFPDISFERFATTLEEFTIKLAKMFEASLQYIWLVVSINQSLSIAVLKSFWPAAFSRQGHGESRFEPGISFSYRLTGSQTRREIENSSLRSGGWIDHKWQCRWCISKTGGTLGNRKETSGFHFKQFSWKRSITRGSDRSDTCRRK